MLQRIIMECHGRGELWSAMVAVREMLLCSTKCLMRSCRSNSWTRLSTWVPLDCDVSPSRFWLRIPQIRVKIQDFPQVTLVAGACEAWRWPARYTSCKRTWRRSYVGPYAERVRMCDCATTLIALIQSQPNHTKCSHSSLMHANCDARTTLAVAYTASRAAKQSHDVKLCPHLISTSRLISTY